MPPSASTGAPALACGTCGVAEDLWACLVCGHIGCSRYREEHAKLHREQAQHDFALSLISQQVWDYASDGLAHRLIIAFSAGDDDGGVSRAFELPDRASDDGPVASKLMGTTLGGSLATGKTLSKKGLSKQLDPLNVETKQLIDAKVESKVEEMCLEFTRQLAAQLEAQRRHLTAVYASLTHDVVSHDPSEALGSTITSNSGSANAEPLGSLYTPYENTASRHSAKWSTATAATQALRHKLEDAAAESAALEREERQLTAQQETLKAHMKESLLRRHHEAEARKARIRELNEMIAEGQLNLDARRRVAGMGLSAADQASSFAAAQPSRATRRRR
jgi:anti-sigma28 factor (negative regulator of flagellin synthesis)